MQGWSFLSLLASTLGRRVHQHLSRGDCSLMHPPAGPGTSPDQLLEALDPEQRAVATALRGPVRVLAGAGTGKTRGITHRIAYGGAAGFHTPPEVLAPTSPPRAAGETRTRLGSLGAGGVQA